MAAARVVILGCGYTGKRVAHRLLAQGHEVIATARDSSGLRQVSSAAIPVDVESAETLNRLDSWITPETVILYSLPSVGSTDLTGSILSHLTNARRVVEKFKGKRFI